MWPRKRHTHRRHDLVVKLGECRALVVIAADMQRLQASPLVQWLKSECARRVTQLVPRSCQGSLVEGSLDEVGHHDHHRPSPQMLPAPDKIVRIISPPEAFEGRNDVVLSRFGLAGKFDRVAYGI